MRKRALYTLGLLAGVSLSCGTDINSGIDPNCPAGQICDPNNPTDPNQKPDTVVGVGPGGATVMKPAGTAALTFSVPPPMLRAVSVPVLLPPTTAEIAIVDVAGGVEP